MKALRALIHVAGVVNVLALYLLNFPTRATAFGFPLPTYAAALLPLVALALLAVAAHRASARWGAAAVGTSLLLAATAKVPTLSAGVVVYVLSLLLYVETLSAAQRFASFEAAAKAAGAELTLSSAEASQQYLRFAWWPLTLTGLVTLAALLAPLALGPLGAPARYLEAVELHSAYGVALVGLAVLGLFGLVVLVKTRLVAARRG